jgi:hypothetical protein
MLFIGKLNAKGTPVKGNRSNFRHGLRGSRVWCAWMSMKTRCMNLRHPSYRNYGQRGITVCERWLAFDNFFADMGHPPPGHTLDRIDNNGPYEPGNCRWASKKEQANNTRVNRMVTLNGEVMTAMQYAERTGIKYCTVMYRLVRAALEPAPRRGDKDAQS